MSIFKCKMCGGTLEIQPNETVAECEYCGTKQTLPKLDDGRKANLFDRANHFRRNNEFDKAAGIYEQILNEDGSDAETYWSLVLCRYGIEYVEDPATHKRVPTVNRAQFTSIFDDDNYKSALNYADGYQRSIYEDEAKAINEIQKGILAISQKEEPFDVFICYKETDNSGRRTPDSVLATDLYHQLTQEGFKVFFSRITLEDKLGTAYEPYIFAALNSAKVMVVLGTRPEYFNAVWVKNEWSRYLALIRGGEKKMLIPAYKDMDPYDLPEEFSHLQAQDMSKLGFMQDLIRGVKKILAEDAPKLAAKETVVVNAGNANTAALLERAFMFLEDGDWKSADEYCERVLDTDPKNAQAYLGKLMAELRVYTREELKSCEKPFYTGSNYDKVMRFGDAALQAEMREANSHIRYTIAIKAKEQANTELAYRDASRKFMMLEDYRDAAKQRQECLDLAETVKKNEIYAKALEKSKSNSIEMVEDAIKQYQTISGWKDTDNQIYECQQRIEKLKADAEADRLEKARKAEIEEKAAAERAKRNKKIVMIAAPVAVVVIAFLFVLNSVIIPNSKYDAAIALMDAKNYDEAIEIWSALGSYKDSVDQNNRACYEKAKLLLDGGKHDDAIALLLDLASYEDSSNLVRRARYEKGQKLFETEQYSEAKESFSASSGYLDSLEYIKFINGLDAMSAEEYNLACTFFNDIGEKELFGDQIEVLITECSYLYVMNEKQMDLSKAVARLKQLPKDYKDVDVLLQRFSEYLKISGNFYHEDRRYTLTLQFVLSSGEVEPNVEYDNFYGTLHYATIEECDLDEYDYKIVVAGTGKRFKDFSDTALTIYCNANEAQVIFEGGSSKYHCTR